MANVLKQSHQNADKTKWRYCFHCPGCGYAHYFEVPGWQWDGNMEKPTISPSILVRGTKTCHSFVKKGQIQFLADCDHTLKGQTVDLPPWQEPEWKNDERTLNETGTK